jgi:proteasome lid subunit RPN8/RPN11
MATTADKASTIVLPAGLYRNMVDHLWRSFPLEGVGLLATRATGDRLLDDRFYAGRNMDRSATRYTMDPADVLSALSDMERQGTWLGAIVHSHPQTPPMPSVTDLAEASTPGVLSLIVGFSPVVRTRAWNLIFSVDGFVIRGEEVRVEV